MAIGVSGSWYHGGNLAVNSSNCDVGTFGNPCAVACPVSAITTEDVTAEPDLPPPDCVLFPLECEDSNRSIAFNNWINNQCVIRTPKSGATLLQSEALKWGMTVESYIADKLDLISQSGGFKNSGKIARNAGFVGIGFGAYSAVVAVSDGNLTANDLLGLTSTALGVVALVPGVGTAVGLGGLALISAGSLVLGLISNTEIGSSTTIANFDTKNKCN